MKRQIDDRPIIGDGVFCNLRLVDANGNEITTMGWSIDDEGFISADTPSDLAEALDYYSNNPGKAYNNSNSIKVTTSNTGTGPTIKDPYVEGYKQWADTQDREEDKQKCFMHRWKRYTGLTEVYDYCTVCDEKQEVKV